jgi:Lon protease-like protein
MIKLPLFPLNTVLFPGVPLTLHIFEERYKMMIGQCVNSSEPFGVVALQSGFEIEGFGRHQAEPYSIGCLAQITQVQPLMEGRMNIVAVGQQRFKVIEFQRDLPYLVGLIEYFPLRSEVQTDLERAGQQLRRWIERYLKSLGQTENLQLDLQQLPKDTLELAYLGASILRVSTSEKQALLAADSELKLLHSLNTYYRKEVTLLEVLLESDKAKEDGPFSLN